ncbi:PI-PLC X domain-containing protein 3-like [Ptychodera flava]|uniref:PI-PLC X domain-containing protein 3-like n=1 Tax=Ptychodera flava TaxID=63121 RepID=UPI00396A0E4F
MAEPDQPDAASSSSETERDYSNWMANLSEKLCCEPLKNIAIPGSHNSFTSSLDVKSGVAPGSPDTIRNLVHFFGNKAKEIVYKWSVNQSLTLTEQLDRGIRYFDLRVSSCLGKEDLHFVHGLFAGKVVDAMNEINTWLESHPKEVVLLDFNHLFDMQDTHHTQLTKQLMEIFGSKICPSIDVDGCALNILWENQWQVIVFYHNDIAHSNHNLWHGSMIPSVWPRTPEAPKMVNILEAYHTKGRNPDKFHVTQGVLTPTGTTILANIGRDLKSVCAIMAIRNLQFYLKDKTIGAKGVNIVIADFIELHDFVSSVLALNDR